MANRFPWQYSSTGLASIMSLFQSIIFAFCFERDWNQWKLGWDLKLLTAAYTGIMTSGVGFVLEAWCVMKKGPLFAAIFNPLMLALTVLAGSLLFDETLYVGRFLFSTSFIVPLALFFERESLQAINGTVLFQVFLCGLFGGSLLQNLFLHSFSFVSVSYATAVMNVVPLATYIIAVLFRLERMNLTTAAGKAKILGTLTGISGAMILTFCKGKRIQIWTARINLTCHVAVSHATSTTSSIWGCMIALGACLSYSLWLIIQAKMAQKFPWQCSSTALMSIMSSFQGVIFAFCIERDWNQWKLGWDLRLLTAVYTGIMSSGVAFSIVAWCVMKKGPFFVAIFNPLMLALTVLAGSLLLDETLYIGSLIGMMLIVSGLYIALWGKSKEANKASENSRASLPSESFQICETNSRRSLTKG
ncbi:WAT1-related protein At1g25270-like [Prosopis cineraria]|uniref:WAT1-related protein At1g25270-like n=1 Tax=Prosopis cineraria TaxID=364024 RepID=UPI00240F713B|nr:WAT1-related protein At1g25270-like [Prosopis cineraria]